MRRFLLGVLVGLAAVPLLAWVYLGTGRAPVAANDRPFPFEHAMIHRALHARMDAEIGRTPKPPPIAASEENLRMGASAYQQHCASCHGGYGNASSFAGNMFPRAPQFWMPRKDGMIHAIHDPPGEIYWKMTHGIRLTGMPAFETVLSDTTRWQVALLLVSAGKPLPGQALEILRQPLIAASPSGSTALVISTGVKRSGEICFSHPAPLR